MKAKKLLIGGVVLLGTVGMTPDLSATSGKLQTDSIITVDGVTYGQHGDGHWHVAEYHEVSGWYPNGGVVENQTIGEEKTTENNDTTPDDLEMNPEFNTLAPGTIIDEQGYPILDANENIQISQNANPNDGIMTQSEMLFGFGVASPNMYEFVVDEEEGFFIFNENGNYQYAPTQENDGITTYYEYTNNISYDNEETTEDQKVVEEETTTEYTMEDTAVETSFFGKIRLFIANLF